MRNKAAHRFMLVMALLTSSCHWAASQTPLLEKSLTISFNQERMDVVLKRISQQAGFTFSYSPSILEADKIVTYRFENKTVREILDQLFNGTLQYKARGKYIILTKAPGHPKESQVVTGYVVDEATGERLKDVTIYDPVTLSSTLTDSYGYFEIKIDKPTPNLKLAVNKKNYTDTLVVSPPKNGKLLNIQLKTSKEKLATFADSIGSRIKRFWNTKIMAHMSNVSDTLYRRTQFSLVPFIGTNHALSGTVINDYSFNLFGGYSLGVRKLELGGTFNIVAGEVEGVQFAGAFNAVGGDVKGMQVAGVFNANHGIADGAQLAGVFNFNWGGVRHFAAAGVLNFTRYDSRAFQLAGIGNVTLREQGSPHFAGLFNFTGSDARSQLAGSYNFAAGDLRGWQAGGVLNFTVGELKGAQTAGVLNFAGSHLNGVQMAGVLNVAGQNVKGAQVAGVMNVAGGKVTGMQLSGVLNYATKVKGVQVALFNISDSVGGVPFGLMSFVLKGYHKVEVSVDEIFRTNLAFRTGVHKFHNIFAVGAMPSSFGDTTTHWAFGYGIGTAPRLSPKFYLNFDLTSNQVVQGDRIDAINMINKFYIGAEYQIFSKVSVTMGLTLNAYITDTTYEGYWDIFKDYKPEFIEDRDLNNDLNMKLWIGGKIGLRFF